MSSRVTAQSTSASATTAPSAPPQPQTPASSAQQQQTASQLAENDCNNVPYECYRRAAEMKLAANLLEKFQSLRYALETDLLACDARWTLFVAAACSYRYETLLRPFPPRFVSEQMGYNINALVSVINETPKLSVVLQNICEQNYDDLDPEVLDLLHHVLVVMRKPMLRLVDDDEFDTLLKKLDETSDEYRPTHIFEVHVVDEKEKSGEEDFEIHYDMDYPIKLAFHGNKLESYFSMLNNGFQQPRSQSRLSSTTSTSLILLNSLLKSLDYSPNGAGWGASSCGSMISCVTLCEYVDNPEYVEHNDDDTEILIHKSDLVRPRYLLFYGSRFPHEEFEVERDMLGWISRHRYSLSLACYMLLLASIGVANSGSGQWWKHLVAKKAHFLFDVCKRIFVMD